MYIIEFERCGDGRSEQIAVRIFELTEGALPTEPIGEYFFNGSLPELILADGVNFTALKIPHRTE